MVVDVSYIMLMENKVLIRLMLIFPAHAVTEPSPIIYDVFQLGLELSTAICAQSFASKLWWKKSAMACKRKGLITVCSMVLVFGVLYAILASTD